MEEVAVVSGGFVAGAGEWGGGGITVQNPLRVKEGKESVRVSASQHVRQLPTPPPSAALIALRPGCSDVLFHTHGFIAEHVHEAVACYGGSLVVLDLGGIRSADSSGARALVELAEELAALSPAPVALVLAAASPGVMSVVRSYLAARAAHAPSAVALPPSTLGPMGVVPCVDAALLWASSAASPGVPSRLDAVAVGIAPSAAAEAPSAASGVPQAQAGATATADSPSASAGGLIIPTSALTLRLASIRHSLEPLMPNAAPADNAGNHDVAQVSGVERATVRARFAGAVRRMRDLWGLLSEEAPMLQAA